MAPGDLDIHCYSLARYLTLLARFDTVALEMLFASICQHAVIQKHSIFDEIYAARMDLVATGKHPMLSGVRANLGKFMPDHVLKKSRTEKVLDHLAGLGDADRLIDCPDLLDTVSRLSGCDLIQRHANSEDVRGDDARAALRDPKSPGTTWFLRIDGRMIDVTLSGRDLKETVYHPLKGDKKRRSGASHIGDIPKGDVSHAIRLMDQLCELGETAQITFPRPNAELLLKIKSGDMEDREMEMAVGAAFTKARVWEAGNMPFRKSGETLKTDYMLIKIHRRVISQLVSDN